MINKLNFLKNKSEDKRNLFTNFLSLLFLQGANYILPLLTVPYLLRVVGASRFGIIVFGQAFVYYFIILTEYGFNLHAAKEISIHREDKTKISKIFCSIMFTKLLFLVISSVIFILLVLIFSKFRAEIALHFFFFGTVIGHVLFPVWFFQGMEKMKYTTFLNILAKLIFTIAIFVFVKNESHYVYVPLMYSLGFITAGIVGIYSAFKDFQLSLHIPSYKAIIENVKNSTFFFLSKASLSVYKVTNAFFLGLLTTNEITGYYGAVEKLIHAITMLNQPIISALYPYISRTKNKVLWKKIFYKWSFLVAALIFAVCFLFSTPIITIIYGNNMTNIPLMSNLLRLFSIEIPIVYPCSMLGVPFLVALGYAKYFNMSIIVASIFHIIGLLCLSPFINLYNVIILTLITETIVLSIRIYAIKKNNLWQFD